MSEKLGINTIGEFQPRQIIAGDFQRVTKAVTLNAGAVYPMGSVLGIRSANGLCKLVDSAQDDGTETVYAILGEDVDATEGQAVGAAFLTGEFIRDALTFGGSDTWETHEQAARALSIFFKDAE